MKSGREGQRPEERRDSERVRVNFRARWATDTTEQDGLVTDVSQGGCFVFSSAPAETGELLRIELMLPAGGSLTLWGHAAHVVERIGFGVRFARYITADDRRKLEWLIKAEARRRKPGA